MNPVFPKSIYSFVAARVSATFLSLLLTSSAFAAAQTPADQKAQHLAVHRQVKSDALALAKNGNVPAAEEALHALNVAQPGSASWHLETAQRLVQLAGDLSRSGRAPLARTAAARALDALTTADRLPGSGAMLKAAIQQQRGFIYERYLGDVENAKASYRAAALLLPQNASAQAKLKQFEETDAATRRKLGHQ